MGIMLNKRAITIKSAYSKQKKLTDHWIVKNHVEKLKIRADMRKYTWETCERCEVHVTIDLDLDFAIM